jgi:hypothetical protein
VPSFARGSFARASEAGVRAALDANLLVTVWGCRHTLWALRALRSRAAARRSDPGREPGAEGEAGSMFTPSIVNVASVLARRGTDGVVGAGVLGESGGFRGTSMPWALGAVVDEAHFSVRRG